MEILIVDDDESKTARITDVFRSNLSEYDLDIEYARTVAEAVNKLEGKNYSLLVLDINLPIRAGEQPRRDGGIKLLRSIVRGPRLRPPQHIFGLTAFEDLEEEFSSEFSDKSWQLLNYSSNSTEWENTLSQRAYYVVGALDRERQQNEYHTDIAIVTALKKIELEAVLKLPANWSEKGISGDDTVYHVGEFRNGDRVLKVVCASAIEMGMAAAACISQKIVANFRPKFLSMAGIAAGIGGNFGDIIFADQSWDYGSGKVKENKERESIFAPAPNYIGVDAGLKEKAMDFAVNRIDVLRKISDEWQGNKPDTELKLLVGPVASGAAVLESNEAIDAIQSQNRKVIGVEMETYGVFLAGRTSRNPAPRWFSAKSVCDFGVPPKTDEHQRYAAYTSAKFIYEFSLNAL